MKKVTDLSLYKSDTDLELCLALIEDAYHDLRRGYYDLAKSQLYEILETFDKGDAYSGVSDAHQVVRIR